MIASAADNQTETIYPRGGGLSVRDGRWPWRACMVPVSWFYHGVASAVKNTRMIDVGPTPPDAQVVSIGNLEVGGGGKTPLAVYFLERIAAAGGRPVYVSRAFRSVSEKLNAVTVVLPQTWDAPAPLRPGVRYLERHSPALAREIGDEGAMIAGILPGVALAFSRQKRQALEYAARCLGASHIILDDAFQSWGVPRDLDVVLLDGSRPFGDGWLLPAGTLREPPGALERADIIGFNGVDGTTSLERAAEAVFRTIGASKPVFGIRREIEIANGQTVVTGSSLGRCAALSAIGRPEAFERSLGAKGTNLAVAFRYPDHYRYSREDVDWIRREAERRRVARVITTEKDWAKLVDLGCPAGTFAVARLRLEIIGEDPIIKRKAVD